MTRRRIALFAFAALTIALAGGAAFLSTQERASDLAQIAALEPAAGMQKAAGLPDERKAHILGNHKHGAGVSCKSEFPAGWSDEKIFSTLQTMAANDNMPWKHEDNGYDVAEQDVDGLKVRVVLNREENIIVTGYPVSVERNPCPSSRSRRMAPANDNAAGYQPAEQ